MNRFLFAITLISASLFLSCNGEQGNNPPAQTASQQPEVQGYANKPKAIEDSRYARLLVLNYWVFEKYYHPEKPKKDLGKGRWFKFEKDGSFVSGRWEDQTASGSWRLYTRENKQFILLDSTNDKEDAEFEIQAINGEEDTMAWVGTEAYPEFKPVSLIITNLLSIPTKAQFGLQ